MGAAPSEEPGGRHEEYDPLHPLVPPTTTVGAQGGGGAGAALEAALGAASLGVELLVPNAGAGALIGRGGHTVQRVCKVACTHGMHAACTRCAHAACTLLVRCLYAASALHVRGMRAV